MALRGSTRGLYASFWANDVDGDPLDEIMGYLGLGAKPSRVLVDGRSAGTAPDSLHQPITDGERLLATSGLATLWVTGNEVAEWIELRGPFATVRVTRSKAKLLVDLRQCLERWADGESPQVKVRELSICSARRFGALVLEVSYKNWKPVRVTRDQALALVHLIDHVAFFASS